MAWNMPTASCRTCTIARWRQWAGHGRAAWSGRASCTAAQRCPRRCGSLRHCRKRPPSRPPPRYCPRWSSPQRGRARLRRHRRRARRGAARRPRRLRCLRRRELAWMPLGATCLGQDRQARRGRAHRGRVRCATTEQLLPRHPPVCHKRCFGEDVPQKGGGRTAATSTPFYRDAGLPRGCTAHTLVDLTERP